MATISEIMKVPIRSVCPEQRGTHARLGRPVVVGNASAKSWGPPNELAYLQHFGTLDADVVILELSSHDYALLAPTQSAIVERSSSTPHSLTCVDLRLPI